MNTRKMTIREIEAVLKIWGKIKFFYMFFMPLLMISMVVKHIFEPFTLLDVMPIILTALIFLVPYIIELNIRVDLRDKELAEIRKIHTGKGGN